MRKRYDTWEPRPAWNFSLTHTVFSRTFRSRLFGPWLLYAYNTKYKAKMRTRAKPSDNAKDAVKTEREGREFAETRT